MRIAGLMKLIAKCDADRYIPRLDILEYINTVLEDRTAHGTTKIGKNKGVT